MVPDNVEIESIYISDTVLHPLNGEFVVDLRVLPMGFIWLSPDDADAVADRIKECAALARQYKESVDQ